MTRKKYNKKHVADMFDNIAGSYDFLNHFLSCGIDYYWRKKTIQLINKHQSYPSKNILDIACGTGDLSIALSKLNPDTITGADISEKMIDVGIKKIASKNLTELIQLKLGDAENLAFDENSFDLITIGFGVRNFETLEKGLLETFRVLRKDAIIVILEFSLPQKAPIKQLYKLYLNQILPTFGKLFSGNNNAYSYLSETVNAFPYGDEFLAKLSEAGFTNTKAIPLSGGIASVYIGKKP